MIVLSCNDVSKAYVVENIIENISFTVDDNEKVGLIGLNGAGKTTLFNILTERLEPDQGSIFRAKGKKLGYLKQNTNIESEKSIMNEMLTIYDNVIKMEEELHELSHKISSFTENDDPGILEKLMNTYASLSEKFEDEDGYSFKSHIKGVLRGLGFSDSEFDKPINLLSGGQKSRVMLAKLLLEKADILLLDEPTNHLDIEAISWLEKYIKDFKGAVILISHDRYFLDNTVERVFLMENKFLKAYNGNYTEFMKKRKSELELEMKQYEEYEKEIERQEEMIRRLHAYGSKRNIRQAFSRQKALDKIKKMDKPSQDSRKVKLRFTPKIKSGRDVLKVEKMGISFNEFEVFNNLNMEIYRGEKVGIIGPNGIGKTTLLKTVAGKLVDYKGNFTLGHYVQTGYYDQEQTNLDSENTVIDEIWDENPTLNYYDIRTMLAQFLFNGDDLYKIVGDLSGGEKGRLSLLKLMTSNANFLLMDEPTNHLDIDSKEVLEDALLNYEGTVLVVSHDRYFLNKVANKIYDMSKDGISPYLGNYDYYLQKKAELEENEDDVSASKTKTQIIAEKKKEREIIRGRQQREKGIKKIEEQIEMHENEISVLEDKLCQPSTYDDKFLIIELNEKLNIQKIELEELYNQWAEIQDN
ncbi:MAG: ABC-F family ATP-binding cassette domain-containing protein [Sedimentibacter saalensis]|uniref:ATP-binding cassette subfamily F protein 3 n=1 Tax=Sedimentibacter saalensis TaxID=130788 RepID=A0A562JB90_9FIRM|nr:ABC-F family ATP-binding cassette domain-containing protein [Sedimentibacter saalensis]MEA5096861.1 ABC-F family ATP-binding cassette domain-containing protein [Sedimentibacter saalensis]TWH80506.1 ATP-binding cassette subfamily F protein 3 [Sedimentibacter saalensis]